MALAAAVVPLYLGFGVWPAVVMALAAGATVGLANGSMVALVGLQPIVVATLALLVAGRGIRNTVGLGYPVFIAAALAVLAGLLLQRTGFGHGILAIVLIGGTLCGVLLLGVIQTLVVPSSLS